MRVLSQLHDVATFPAFAGVRRLVWTPGAAYAPTPIKELTRNEQNYR